jgi:acyl-CoA synthetase (AMP-forming)/AMP-acid ligase II
MDNSIEAIDFLIGCTVANLVRVPLYPRNVRPNHAHMLAHTQCRVLVTADHYLHEVLGLDTEIETLDAILVVGPGWEAELSRLDATDPGIKVDPSDWYVIRHTGGTTGRPKGVPYSHRTWLAAGRDWFYNFPPVQAGDACLHICPISHGSGYFFTPLWLAGGRNILLDHFTPGETLDLMERERVGYMFVVPTILSALAREASALGRSWPDLKVINVAGGPTADETARMAVEVFPQRVYQTYGQTEDPIPSLTSRSVIQTPTRRSPVAQLGRLHYKPMAR